MCFAFRIIFAGFALILLVCLNGTQAQIELPVKNSGVAVKIDLGSGRYGSGFILKTEKYFYLVTAKHVLFDMETNQLISPTAMITNHRFDKEQVLTFTYQLDLVVLLKSKHASFHPEVDVAVVCMGRKVDENETTFIYYNTGVKHVGEHHAPGPVVFGLSQLRLFDSVILANDIYILGYPTSLSRASKMIDNDMPLLRKGVVAGFNRKKNVIIIDSPAYPGNSGGPVIEVEKNKSIFEFPVIGVLSEFVPYAETWLNLQNKWQNHTFSNSGYAVVIPMDFVLEMVE